MNIDFTPLTKVIEKYVVQTAEYDNWLYKKGLMKTPVGIMKRKEWLELIKNKEEK